MNKVHYTPREFEKDVIKIAQEIIPERHRYSSIYGVPSGGVPLATALAASLHLRLTDTPNEATLIVDDIIDSGKTRARFPLSDFFSIHRKSNPLPDGILAHTWSLRTTEDWIVYFWEGNETRSIGDSVIRQLQYIGENPDRQGLQETPSRVIKSYAHLYSGYQKDPADIMKCFDSETYDQIILLKDVEMFSMCEHHMLPFIGKAHIAYIPNGKVLGISKLARLLEIYSRRLQIQERIGEQVTEALMQHLKPRGAACIIEAKHLCMQMRGVEKQHSSMVTSSLKGAFLTDPAARTELMGLIK